tara:strand:- start:2602 stop:4224 length:1623 start_codon:yes stop_codon:yes gene_type:complete
MPEINLNPYNAEADAIARRRKLAELLAAQASQPLPTNETAGGYVVPVSPYAGLAKMLQAGTAAYGNYKADKDTKALSERQVSDRSATMDEFAKALAGTPARGAVAMPPGELGGGPGREAVPAQPGSPMAAIAALLASKDPSLQNAGMSAQLAAVAAAQKSAAESPYAKIDPSKFTPESIEQFTAGGGKNYNLLRARDKLEFVNTGSAITPMNPYGGTQAGQAMPIGVSPNTTATLNMDMFKHLNLSENQRRQLEIAIANANTSAANAQNTGIETQFNTGRGVQPPTPFQQGGFSAPVPGGNAAPVAPPAQPTPAPTPANFPRIDPATQSARNAEQIALLQRELTLPVNSNPADQQRIRAEIAKLSTGQPFAAPGGDPLPPATPKTQQAAVLHRTNAQTDALQQLPQVISRAEQALQQIDDMVGSVDGKKPPHPGFSDVVGMGMPGWRFVPGTDAADFDRRLDQIKGSSFMQAFESLKGGGQITEVEGKKATDAIERMARSQSEKEFTIAAREFQSVVRTGVNNAKARAGQGGTNQIVVDW